MPGSKHYAGELDTLASDYANRGRKEAGKHRPPTQATQPDQNETELRLAAGKWLSNEQRSFDHVLAGAQHAALSIEQKCVDLDHRITQLVGDRSLDGNVDAELSQERESLIAAITRRIRAEVALRAFCQQNGVTDVARYPESVPWHFAMVAAIALVETVMNAFFYENAQGLLGGFVVALMIAVMNTGTAVVLGVGFRYRNLTAPDKKAFGWTCLALFAVQTIFFNALFATFRSAYMLVVDPTDYVALRQAFADSWEPAWRIFVGDVRFADMLSFILFGVGILLSVFSFYKGMTVGDRYPGHAPRDQALRQAATELGFLEAALFAKVKAFLHRRLSDLHAAAQEFAVLINRASTHKTELKHAVGLLTSQANSVQRDFARVLGAYRQANMAVRGIDPPAYFSETPNLVDQIATVTATPVLEQLSQVQQGVTVLRDARQEELNRHIEEHQSKAADMLAKTFKDFVQGAEQDAKSRISASVLTIHRPMEAFGNANQ
jgi:hypothetical protein